MKKSKPKGSSIKKPVSTTEKSISSAKKSLDWESNKKSQPGQGKAKLPDNESYI